MRFCVALLALVACRDASSPASAPGAGSATTAAAATTAGSATAAAPADAPDDGSKCPAQPFAQSTPLAEASGAAWLTIDGRLSLVAVADSGHTGDYAILDPDTGETREQGKLPLGTLGTTKLGDDLEGLAARGDTLFGVTSDGWMRAWRRAGKRFELVDGPYAIGSDADGTTCTPPTKCPINYEGLAIAPEPPAGANACVGFACSKGDGHLYCLTEQKGRYVIDRTRRIPVTRAGVLADCAFSDRGTLWVGNNAFGLNEVFRIDGWADPAHAKAVSTNAFGIGFPEVIAARGDVIYRMSDTGGSPSLLGKFRCSPNAR